VCFFNLQADPTMADKVNKYQTQTKECSEHKRCLLPELWGAYKLVFNIKTFEINIESILVVKDSLRKLYFDITLPTELLSFLLYQTTWPTLQASMYRLVESSTLSTSHMPVGPAGKSDLWAGHTLLHQHLLGKLYASQPAASGVSVLAW